MRCTFDNFVARLLCPVCGAVSAANHETLMQTRLREEPLASFLGVGDVLKIDLETMDDSGYLLVQPPPMGHAVHFLQSWRCPSCETWPLWAEIVIANDVIESIQAATLGKETLARTNYVEEDEARGVAANMIGCKYEQLPREKVVPTLKARFESEDGPVRS